MKHILITIAAVVLVGCVVLMWCWPSMDIYTAAGTGNIGAVKKHLDAGVDVNAKDWLDGTPLHSAAVFGNKKIAQLLIDNGAHVNEKDAYGCTPLHYAAAKEHKDIAELLIEKGADASIFVKGKLHAQPIWKTLILNLALLLMGIGAGVMIGGILAQMGGVDDDIAMPGSIFLLAGTGLLIGFFITKKMDEKD